MWIMSSLGAARADGLTLSHEASLFRGGFERGPCFDI